MHASTICGLMCHQLMRRGVGLLRVTGKGLPLATSQSARPELSHGLKYNSIYRLTATHSSITVVHVTFELILTHAVEVQELLHKTFMHL